jgi:hypothetical protein
MSDVLLREVAEEAGRRIPRVELGGVLAEGSRRARFRRARRRVAVGVAVGAVAAAALLVPLPRLLRSSAPAPASPGPKLVVRIELSRTTAKVGSSIPVVVLITNTTGRPITTSGTCPDPRGWMAVGLERPGLVNTPGFLTPYCQPSLRLPPGTSRFSMTISGIFYSCSEKKAAAIPPYPWCGESQALPPGRYTTKVVIHINPPETTAYPPPVTVTLTP